MSHNPDMKSTRKTSATYRAAGVFGQALRAARKRENLSQAQLSAMAGVPRQRLIELEKGKPGVSLAAYALAVAALGLELNLKPAKVRLADYPQLQLLAWNRPGQEHIPEREALALYERNWDHVDRDLMPPWERELIQRLVALYGNGVLHV